MRRPCGECLLWEAAYALTTQLAQWVVKLIFYGTSYYACPSTSSSLALQTRALWSAPSPPSTASTSNGPQSRDRNGIRRTSRVLTHNPLSEHAYCDSIQVLRHIADHIAESSCESHEMDQNDKRAHLLDDTDYVVRAHTEFILYRSCKLARSITVL